MFSKSSQFYDLIYASFKDYPAEAVKVAALISRIHPEAKSILDVACGTAEHARLLMEHYGYDIDGLDLDSGLLAVAKAKLPRCTFVQATMQQFDMGQRYDVVMCLFSSIAYLRNSETIVQALLEFRRHLSPGGKIIVEPWFSPDTWEPGKIGIHTVQDDAVTVCRMSYSQRSGNISKVRFEYLIGTADGIFHEAEDHELGLLTVEEMQDCFARAGLRSAYEPEGLFGRGLYVADVR